MKPSAESVYLGEIRKRIRRLRAAGEAIGPIDWRARMSLTDDPQERAALDFLAREQGTHAP